MLCGHIFTTYSNYLFSEDLSKLKYIHWCIKEGLRHYPPVYSIFRDLPEDTVLDGHKLPKGSTSRIQILISYYSCTLQIHGSMSTLLASIINRTYGRILMYDCSAFIFHGIISIFTTIFRNLIQFASNLITPPIATHMHSCHFQQDQGSQKIDITNQLFLRQSYHCRNCIGQNFAQNEEKIVIASVLNK